MSRLRQSPTSLGRLQAYLASTPEASASRDNREAHLDERVDHTNVGTGVKHFVEACFSVHQLQLVELLVVLAENSVFLGNFLFFLF